MHGPGDVKFFDKIARFYDAVMPPARRDVLAAGLAYAERPVERALDIGGGTGRAALGLDVSSPVVVDVASGMIQRAQKRGLPVIHADARALPVRDDSVDAVVVVDAFHHMPERERVLAEAARVLAPGGVLVVREFDPETLLGRGLVLGERVLAFDSAFFTPDELASLVGDAGLDPTVVDRGFGYTVAGVNRASSSAENHASD